MKGLVVAQGGIYWHSSYLSHTSSSSWWRWRCRRWWWWWWWWWPWWLASHFWWIFVNACTCIDWQYEVLCGASGPTKTKTIGEYWSNQAYRPDGRMRWWWPTSFQLSPSRAHTITTRPSFRSPLLILLLLFLHLSNVASLHFWPREEKQTLQSVNHHTVIFQGSYFVDTTLVMSITSIIIISASAS